MLSAKTLRKHINYDPISGLMTWNIPTSPKTKRGDSFGTISKFDGYMRAQLLGHQDLIHRFAWLYVYGRWPKGQIDHADDNRSNNAIGNLRDVTPTQNQHYRSRVPINNTSGFVGVTLDKRFGKWMAHIKLNGKFINLGYFNTPEEANYTRVAAKNNFHQKRDMQ